MYMSASESNCLLLFDAVDGQSSGGGAVEVVGEQKLGDKL
jgi:hypothetical protein